MKSNLAKNANIKYKISLGWSDSAMSIQEFAFSAEWGQPSHSLPSIIYNVYHL